MPRRDCGAPLAASAHTVTAPGAMRRVARGWVLAAVFLAACAPLAPPPEAPAPRPPRESIERFAVEARVAVKDGERSFTARLDWRHDAAADEMVLSSPLGQGIARLVRDAAGARLDTADARHFEDSDLEALSAQVFGQPLPLAGMPRWLLGRRADGGRADRHDSRGRPTLISERGWRVEYAGYESEAGDALPNLVHFSREPLELRLRIDRWVIAE